MSRGPLLTSAQARRIALLRYRRDLRRDRSASIPILLNTLELTRRGAAWVLLGRSAVQWLSELGVLRAELRRRGIAVPPASVWWKTPPQPRYPEKGATRHAV